MILQVLPWGDDDPLAKGRRLPPCEPTPIVFPPDLPDLQHDPFDWTPAELDEAVRVARAVLFNTGKKTVSSVR